MSKRKAKLKPKVKIIILTILTLFLLLGTVLVSNKYTLKKVAEFVTYKASGNFNYEVCYKDNDYVSDKCFSDENRAFVNALINNINVDFNYTLNLSQNAEKIYYKYIITAQVLANEKNNSDKILYSETETLFKESKTFKNYSLVLINKIINVDFQKYNNIITEFKKNYVLSMDSKLIITATLDITGEHSHLENSIKNHRESKLIFTLAEQTVNTEKDNTIFNQGDTVVKYTKVPFLSKEVLIVLITYVLDIIFLGMWIYILIISHNSSKTYTGKINKILKQYDRAIVKVMNLPPTDELEEIRVASFEELLDVRDNLSKPILYRAKNSSAKFVVINDKQAFIYELGVYFEYEN